MIIDTDILKKYTKEELINYIVMSNIPPRFRELLNTVAEGNYNTRYMLCKYYPSGTVSSFIRHGTAYGYLKKEYVWIGKKMKAILKPAVPSQKTIENLNITVENN